jgi:hypothetical protein
VLCFVSFTGHIASSSLRCTWQRCISILVHPPASKLLEGVSPPSFVWWLGPSTNSQPLAHN